MWLPLLALILALAALVWSADRFVSAAASLAAHFRVPQLIIGVTVVALGTTAPEIIVAFNASLDGNPLLAVGNAIGSNIANIGLVLGVTAIVSPLAFSTGVLGTEMRWMLGATGLALILLADLRLSAIDGFVLLGGLVYVVLQFVRKNRKVAQGVEDTISDELTELPELSLQRAAIEFLLGLIILLVAADVLVWSATEIAAWLGVSDFVIGLTIVAVGTSLPELSASVGAAIKGHADIAIGNVVGSNILNILTVLTVPAFIGQPQIDHVVFVRDCSMMLALTLALAFFAYAPGSTKVMTRYEGLVALVGWAGYTALVVR